MGNITELNEIIYARAKLVCDNISDTLRNLIRNTKLEGEIRLKGQAKMLKKIEDM